MLALPKMFTEEQQGIKGQGGLAQDSRSFHKKMILHMPKRAVMSKPISNIIVKQRLD